MNNVVLVHGGFVDGSGWEGRLQDLTRNGLQCHRRPKSYDVAGRRRWRTPSELWPAKDGPAILVGHSYGGGGDHWKPETIRR